MSPSYSISNSWPFTGLISIVLAVALTACSGSDGSIPGSNVLQGGVPATARPNASAPSSQEGGASKEPVFVDITEDAGLDFTHVNGMSGEHYIVEMMGAGVALFDFDGDADLDLYLLQGHPLVEGAVRSGAGPAFRDRLYRNDLPQDRDAQTVLSFTDVTDVSGIEATGYGMGAAVGDIDNDGHVDLFVANWGPDELWRNRGDGTFKNISSRAGIDQDSWSAGAAFLDFDRDGWLDLVVVRYIDFRLETHTQCLSPQTGNPDYCGPQSYRGAADSLYRNLGDGTFEDVTLGVGMGTADGPALAVSSADFNGDGWPDLYVANDGVENDLWINQAGRRFENAGPLSGASVNQAGIAEASMGIAAEDFDEDGDLDLFVTHLVHETNTFYVNDGHAFFSDRTGASGLGQASLTSTGFGVASLDYDSDGKLDLYVANGAVLEIREQVAAGASLPLKQGDQLFRGLGDGRFEEVSATAGETFDALGVSRGVAAGDLDNDGDTDLVVTENQDRPRVLENRVSQRGKWVGIEAVAEASQGGRPQLGADVTLLSASTLRRRVVRTDGSYASAKDHRVVIGLGESESRVDVSILWPDGRSELFENLALERYHRLEQGSGR